MQPLILREREFPALVGSAEDDTKNDAPSAKDQRVSNAEGSGMKTVDRGLGDVDDVTCCQGQIPCFPATSFQRIWWSLTAKNLAMESPIHFRVSGIIAP